MKSMRWVVALGLIPSLSFADLLPSLENNTNAGQEYFVGKEQGRPLITVNLISGVKNPGVYHVPVETELPQLLAYAGGTTPKAETYSIAIRRSTQKGAEYKEVDLDKLIRHSTPLPPVVDRDVIMIPEDMTTDNTAKWATVAASFGTLALTFFLISKGHSNY